MEYASENSSRDDLWTLVSSEVNDGERILSRRVKKINLMVYSRLYAVAWAHIPIRAGTIQNMLFVCFQDK